MEHMEQSNDTHAEILLKEIKRCFFIYIYILYTEFIIFIHDYTDYTCIIIYLCMCACKFVCIFTTKMYIDMFDCAMLHLQCHVLE